MIIKTYKPIGITPLELQNIMREKFKIEKNIKMGFAGRLDPMARGEMIFLTGEDCKIQDTYCGKDKIYEFSIIYGFKTDTYDILGLLNDIIPVKEKTNLDTYKGNFNQPYPPFSSILVKGDLKKKQPLWFWAKQNKLDKVEIPKKNINIYEMEKISVENGNPRNNRELFELIVSRIYKLTQENRIKFRVDKIVKEWKNQLLKKPSEKVLVKTYRVKVSSGTYIRSLCDRMGGIAYDINRIRIIE